MNERRAVTVILTVLALLVGLALWASPPAHGATYTEIYRESFNTPLSVGRFKTCAGDYDYRCAGLKGTHYYDTLGAYPSGWPDTATQRGYNQGGYYRPESTVSVVKQSNGDGQLRVKMTSDGATNKVAALVPRKCMNLRYGKFSERFIVRSTGKGFKMAHLHFGPNEEEIDYPEAGGSFATDPVSVFLHTYTEYGKDVAPNATWRGWHTYTQTIRPDGTRFYLDGALVAYNSKQYPVTTPWVLQNESALDGTEAPAGSSVTIDTTWIACSSYSG